MEAQAFFSLWIINGLVYVCFGKVPRFCFISLNYTTKKKIYCKLVRCLVGRFCSIENENSEHKKLGFIDPPPPFRMSVSRSQRGPTKSLQFSVDTFVQQMWWRTLNIREN